MIYQLVIIYRTMDINGIMVSWDGNDDKYFRIKKTLLLQPSYVWYWTKKKIHIYIYNIISTLMSRESTATEF